jgi:hypothetical protein
MSHPDEMYVDRDGQDDARADADFDPAADEYCPNCGLDWPGCACANDPNTNALMRCGAGHEWWREFIGTHTACPHSGCGQESTVVREPMYAPAANI